MSEKSLKSVKKTKISKNISLRDQIAIAVINGMMAHGAYLADTMIDDVTADAYRYADSMLEARK